MRNSYQHIVDFLFPIALFFIFTTTAILVLLLSANTYKGVVNNSEQNFETNTALSYITQKIRQNDDSENTEIYLDNFDGCNALAIKQKISGQNYITYIYEANGELKEAFLQEGVDASLGAGTTILQIDKFKMEQIQDNLFKFSCTSNEGKTVSTIINTHAN